MHELEALSRLEKEIRHTIYATYHASEKAVYQHGDGRRLYLSDAMKEGLENGPVIGALIVVVATGQFMSVDRVIKSNQQFKKQRRIIFYLDSKAGQVGSTLLLELLKMSNGEEFSKPKFVQKIDELYFQSQKINISSGEINEALSRIFRKTMDKFFSVEGRNFVRAPFVLHLQELNVRNNNSKVNYESYKHSIDNETHNIIKKLNRLPTV
ncbi:MAG: hypothetical protein INQ03_05595 [Candidatus Heimdallarchaeota archaeon]|nr:hypothetical protein [Candidatus Heimdallarchaeota archaeon]